MKMMKLLIPALAITAWAHTALATLTTPIYEIRACNSDGAAETEPVASKTSPLKGGDTVRFVVRLLNPEFDTTYGSATDHWKLNYIGLGTEATDAVSAPAGVGVVVNGQTRMAKYVKATYPTAFPFYTDFIFEYEVQPGDIALPIRLAADLKGTPAGSATGIYWFHSDLWEISKVGDPTVKVTSLKFAGSTLIAQADSLGQPDGLVANSDNWDGYECGFYAQTVGFADQSAVYEGTKYWSVVNQGSSTCTPIPTISVTGDPTTASKLYIWSGDDTIAEVVPGNDITSVKTVASMPEPPPGTGFLTGVQVGEISIIAGQSDYKFKVQGKAGQKGKTVKLYLSENPDGFFKQASGDVTDYIEVEIVVGDSLVPNISLAGPTSVSVGSDYENAIGTITLTVSEPLPTTEPDNLVVTLTPSLTTTANVYDYVHIADNNDGSSWNTLTPYSFTLKKGDDSSLTKTIYLFGMGGDSANTATALNPVNFDITVKEETSGTDVTATCYYKMPATLPVRFVPQPPVLSADSLTMSGIGNIDRTFEIKITDNFKNLADATGYTIEYKKDASESDWSKLTGTWKRDGVTGVLVSTADSTTLPALKFTAGTYTPMFRVVTPAGDVKSAVLTFSLTVSAPAQSQAYLVDDASVWQTTGTVTESDTAPVTVGVRLTNKNTTGATIYAFLVPDTTLPDAVNNTQVRSQGKILSTDAAPVGMPILNGESESDLGELYILDGSGTKGVTLSYTVVLSTDQNDPTQVVPGYESKTFKLTALNAVPTIKQVKMGGLKITENGKTFAGAVPQNATRTFSVSVTDVAADRQATGSDQFQYTWVVEEEGGLTLDPGGYGTITGDPNLTTATFNYTFQLTGTAKVTLNLRDKDMPDFSEDFVFYVKVGKQPNVSVVSVDGVNYFTEKTTGPNNARMRVILSEPAAVDLTVQLSVTSAATTNIGILELGGATLTSTPGVYPATYDITIPANTTTKDFYIKNLDGTIGSSLEGWTINGAVTTSTASLKDPTKTWAQYYLTGDYYCTVDNVEPTFTCSLGEENTVSNAFSAAIGNGEAVSFSINDIAADLAAPGVKVTWWSTDIGTRTEDIFNLTTSAIQSYTPKFKTAGTKTVKVTVEDKDANSGVGSFTRQWYYEVAASKTLSTLAHGPSAGTSTSALSQHYTSATGLGSGHVWADGTFAGAGGFKIDWNMGTRNVANFYGYGYKPGNTGVGVLDDGNIAGERDIPIDINGDNNTEDGTVASFIASGATPYTSTITDKDSYLYTWLVTTASDGGGMVSQICGSVSPERNGLAAAVGQIALPTAKTDDGTYVETMLEAIFAQEWRTTDNCGDINQDGIPDVAVMKYGFGIYSDGTLDAMNDLTDLSAYNEDEDYLPSDKNPNQKFLPGLSSGWAKSVNAFTAKLEIRGYGDGLNNGTTDMTGVTADVGLANVITDTTPDYSTLEMTSWDTLGGAAVLPAWSPERPTDPTKADTDDDGLPDGYEYYYWYNSYVGYIDGNNKFQRLTGRKLDLEHPEDEGALITWEDIAKAFDPLLPGDAKADARDLDRDGLTDYEEYVLGTSPILWDSDGDGLSDFWEVTYAPSLNPLKASTDNTKADGYRNDDGDYMAQISTVIMNYVRTIDGSGRTVYYGTIDDAITNFVDNASATTHLSFKIGSDVYVYVGTAATAMADLIVPGTTPGKEYLKINVGRNECYLLGTGSYVEDAAEFCKGTEVVANGSIAYNYYTFDSTAAGAALATNDFGPTRSYLLWKYGNVSGARMAMGREATIPPANIIPYSMTLYRNIATVLINHWQVYQWRGFELDEFKDMGTGFCPTTGWFINDNGYVSTRWEKTTNGQSGSMDMAEQFGKFESVGRARDTAQFCALDEFLLDAFFRYATGFDPQDPSKVTFNSNPNISAYYSRYTTLPENLKNDAGEITAYGADSDGDGVPDGWELYVQAGPGNREDKTFRWNTTGTFDDEGNGVAASAYAGPLGPRCGRGRDSWAQNTQDISRDPITTGITDDELSEASEFWGTDSTAAYSGVPAIANIEPVKEGWLNKFWPTDPWSSDTDCDGVADSAESSFVYGSPEDDGKSWWIAGAGTNPCAWDTDRDGLPDVWELRYPGVKFPIVEDIDRAAIGTERLLNAMDDYGFSDTNNIPRGCYGGMDPTTPDSFTGIIGGTGHNCDYDYDGLQNWQEYLTTTIRAFRYDDTTSPWEGYDRSGKDVAIAWVDTDNTVSFSGHPAPAPVMDANADTIITVAEATAYGIDFASNAVVNATAVLGITYDNSLTYPVQSLPPSPQLSTYDLDNDGFLSPLPGTGDTSVDPNASEYMDFVAANAMYEQLEKLNQEWKDARSAAIADWTDGTGITTDYPLNPIYRQSDFGKLVGAGINPNTVFGMVDTVAAYGSICRREWDTSCGAVYFFPDGPNHTLARSSEVTTNQWNAASATMQDLWRPVNAYEQRIVDADATLPGIKKLVVQSGTPWVFGTSPINEDSDADGMDDYYELFHGLNPLYGGAAHDLISNGWSGSGSELVQKLTGVEDGEKVSATNNFWTYYLNSTAAPLASESDYYDFVKFPWMNGSAAADPDGDDLRNQNEALAPDVQANDTYLHTDPTPLWMTDTSYSKSIVASSYGTVRKLSGMDEDLVQSANHWCVTSGYNWNFEENEGFDTDTDWYNDFREGQKGTDAQSAGSPTRRQAMYFPGGFGAVQVQEDQLMSALFNGSKAEQQFTTFTVECWAKPTNVPTGLPGDVKQVLVERMILSREASIGDQELLRRNFQLGINASGYWYVAFDHDGTGSTDKTAVVATATTPAVNNQWTHVAATYDGNQLQLYLNGVPAAAVATSLKPATGALELRTVMEKYTISIPWNSTKYVDRMIESYIVKEAPLRSIIMGAGVNPAIPGVVSSMVLDELTDLNDYGFCYAGYLDEVRIWDGARTSDQIVGNYMTQMTATDIAANRTEIYDGMQEGQSRDVNEVGELPAELVYHYSFDNIAAADAPGHIAQAPFGMASTAPDGRYRPSVPLAWICPWWNDIGSAATASAKSTVYGWDTTYNSWVSYSVVPWIQNTVAHLPPYDGTVLDSVYWKEQFAARTPATMLGKTKLTFANSANPYNHVRKVFSTSARSHTDTAKYFYYQWDNKTGSNYSDMYDFRERADALYNSDALPLGDAYAKYVDDMWDGQGASTTIEVTGTDNNNNGVADWADAVLGSTGKGLGDTITYGGLTDTVAHHYARLLARGAHDGSAAGDTAYVQTADFNSSGLPDWWEDLYNVTGNGLDDDDNDGLSNYTEYLLSEVFDTGKVFNPALSRSIDQHTLDYFYRPAASSLYVGEIFTDHDQVEDAWEDNYADTYSTRIAYDANLDNDGDGWSMRSEARYSQMVKTLSADGREHYNVPGDRIVDLPVPTLELSVNYDGADQHGVADKGLVVYVRQSGVNDIDFDAKYIVAGASTNATEETSSSDSSTSNAYTQVIGKWSNRHVIGTLTPGNIKSLRLENAYAPDDDTFTWRLAVEDAEGEVSYVYRSGTKAEYRKEKAMYGSAAEIVSFDTEYHNIDSITIRYINTYTAMVYCDKNCTMELGTVNLQTGEYDFDLGVMAGKMLTQTSDATKRQRSEDSIFRIVYDVNPSHGMPRTVYLGQADVGAVKEGKNDIIVVADVDGDGLYTPGEPMGVAVGVDVGWRRGAASITLTETSPISIRMNLATGDNDRSVGWGAWADAAKEGDKEVLSSSLGRYVRMRVIRSYFNGNSFGGEWISTPVLDRNVYLDSEINKFLTEADFITATSPDVDWANGTLYAEADVDATNVQYRVVFGNQTITTNESISDTAKYMFSRRFDSNGSRAKVRVISPDASGNWVVNTVRPTFRWKLDPEALDTYTAFQVVITGAGGFKYDSGVQIAPAKNSAGEYVWTAPICVTDQMAGASTGVYANNTTYSYTVYMYNSKFQTQVNGDTGSYLLNVPEENPAYGSVGARVRYFGPNTTAATAPAVTTQVYGGKTVHLQAFTSPDFTGVPAASTTVNATDIDGAVGAKATLFGLNAGTYYLRAYIDSNDNGVCDDWESSGYLCGQGTAGVASIYNPVGIRFTPELLGTTQEVEIYIEDADTNQNTVPDAWEYAKNPTNWKELPPVGAGAYGKLGIAYVTGVGTDTLTTPVPTKTSPMSVSGGMAGRVLLALSNPTVAALSMGYDSLEAAEAAADTLDESASVVAITSLVLDGTTATVGYTTDVNTVMSATAAKSAFYVASGTTLSFQLVVKTKANLADAWTVADTRTVTVELGTEKSGEITVDVGALPEVAGFMTIELKK